MCYTDYQIVSSSFDYWIQLDLLKNIFFTLSKCKRCGNTALNDIFIISILGHIGITFALPSVFNVFGSKIIWGIYIYNNFDCKVTNTFYTINFCDKLS